MVTTVEIHVWETFMTNSQRSSSMVITRLPSTIISPPQHYPMSHHTGQRYQSMSNKSLPNTSQPQDTLDVSWKVLRIAIDHLEFSYNTHLSDEVWRRCLQAWSRRTPITLKLGRNGTESVPLSAQAAVSDREPDRIIFKDSGVNLTIHVRRPFRHDADGASKSYRCVRVSVHGTWLSRRRTGRSLIKQIRSAVEAWFFEDRGKTPKARRSALAPVTRPGRIDIADDIAVSGKDAEDWIEGGLFAGGNRDSALRPWPKWAHRRGALPGTQEHGRSVVLVGKHLRHTVYEKDKQMLHEKAVEWPAFQKLLQKVGWNGTDRILRRECSLRPEWLRSQTYTHDGKEIRGRDATLDELLALLPTIMMEIWRRNHHRVPHPTRRRDHWPLSTFWKAIEPDPDLFAAGRKGAASVGTMQTERRVSTSEKRWARACNEVLRLVEVGGADGESLTLKAVFERLGRDCRLRREQPQYAAVRLRWRAEVGKAVDAESPARGPKGGAE